MWGPALLPENEGQEETAQAVREEGQIGQQEEFLH